jgi:hypothetical protein
MLTVQVMKQSLARTRVVPSLFVSSSITPMIMNSSYNNNNNNKTNTIAVRYLNVHEYISMELMSSHGIKTPECHVAETVQEVEHIFNTSFHRSGTLKKDFFFGGLLL